MANAVNVNFRMDPDLKRSMEEVCAEIIDNVAVGADIILVDFKLFGYYLLQSFEY